MLKSKIHAFRSDPFNEYFEQCVRDYKLEISDDTPYTIKEHFKGKAYQDIKRCNYQNYPIFFWRSPRQIKVRIVDTHIRACVADALEDEIIRVDFTRKTVITGEPPKKDEEKHINYEESKKVLKGVKRVIQAN